MFLLLQIVAWWGEGQKESLKVADWLGGLRVVGRKLEVGEREESVREQWRKPSKSWIRHTRETQNQIAKASEVNSAPAFQQDQPKPSL